MFILFYFTFCFLDDAGGNVEGGGAAVVFAYADAVAAALLYAEKRYFCHRGALGQVVELDGRAAFKTFGYLSLQRRRITAVYFAVIFNLEHDVSGCVGEVVPLRSAFSRYGRGGIGVTVNSAVIVDLSGFIAFHCGRCLRLLVGLFFGIVAGAENEAAGYYDSSV